MFQSVINQPGLSAGRFGTGVWVSLLLHAGVLTAMVGVSGKAVVEQIQKDRELVFVPPQPPRGNPNPPKAAQAVTPTKPKRPKTELRQPKNIQPPPPDTQPVAEPPPTPVAGPEPIANHLPYIPGSDPNGVETGGVPGAKAIAGLALGNSLGTGEEVLPFGAGMSPPQLLSAGVPLQYTYEAARARVSGTVIAKCTITREGDVENCRILRGLPFMDEAVLESLTSRHYRPVHFQGRAVSVSYTFHVKLQMP